MEADEVKEEEGGMTWSELFDTVALARGFMEVLEGWNEQIEKFVLPKEPRKRCFH